MPNGKIFNNQQKALDKLYERRLITEQHFFDLENLKAREKQLILTSHGDRT